MARPPCSLMRRPRRGRTIPQALSPTAGGIPLPQSPEIIAIQGTNLTPYVLKVEIREDIISKIKAFAKEESWKEEPLVILSATGSISSVSRIVPKGRYDILRL
ncbi:uncharacterized protein LOC121771130 [Salvia splendens]|uniref:uncharacterized protein LOC121771130 n=1 Tax=Salvia splendens TaxID=180675 RepID=UPI001C261744|nr:uncharacterized protein LOC121771130 [Salvia splendens]